MPKRLKQTFPHEYKFGLNLTLPCPVVVRLTFGGEFGYVSSKYISNSYAPWPYGVSEAPIISALSTSTLFSSHLTNIEFVCSIGRAVEISANS